MRIAIKWLDGTKWKLLDIQELVGTSLAEYMQNSGRTIVAALYDEGDKPVAFVSNSKQYVEEYKAKGISLDMEDIKTLLGDNSFPKAVATIFPDSQLVEIKTIQEAHESLH